MQHDTKVYAKIQNNYSLPFVQYLFYPKTKLLRILHPPAIEYSPFSATSRSHQKKYLAQPKKNDKNIHFSSLRFYIYILHYPPFIPPPSEQPVEGVNFVGLRDFTSRPASFNAQACQWKRSGRGKNTLSPKQREKDVFWFFWMTSVPANTQWETFNGNCKYLSYILVDSLFFRIFATMYFQSP